MPVSIKVSQIKYKDANGDYVGINGVSERATAEEIAEIEAACATAETAMENKAAQTIASIPADYTTLNNEVNTLIGTYDDDLLAGVDWTYGYYPNPSGSNLVPNANYKTSDYIPVEPGKTYYTDSPETFCHICNANKEVIQYFANNNRCFTVTDETAAYARIGYNSVNGGHLYTKDEFVDILKNAIWTNGVYIEGGTIKQNADWKTTDFIPVAPRVQFTKHNVGGCFVNFYRSRKTFLSGWASTTDSFSSPDDDRVFYVRISIPVASSSGQITGRTPNYIVYGKSAFEVTDEYSEMLLSIKNSEAYREREYHIGADQQYTTLRSGIAAAMTNNDATVYVHAGVYDLEQEFAEELAEHTASHVGIPLGRNIHVIFYDGAKVICNLEQSSHQDGWAWIAEHFEPFYASYADQCNFIIENADFEMKNTRYCVHDELAGINADYIHKYLNCKMKFTSSRSSSEFKVIQCIGGGIGRHGNIVIDGGLYESIDLTGVITDLTTISYHNANNANAKSTIHIKNVYSKGRSYFRFGCYGPSTEVSPVLVNSCSMGLPPLVVMETPQSTIVNFELYNFCNDIRIPGHWENGSYIES